MNQDESVWTYMRIASVTAMLTVLGACDQTTPVVEAHNTLVASSASPDVEMQEVVVVASRSHP